MVESSQADWDASVLGGSMKRGIVNPDLVEERAKCTFDQNELERFTISSYIQDGLKELGQLREKYPELKGDFSEFEMTREEMIEDYWKKNKKIFEVGYDRFFANIPEEFSKMFSFTALDQGINPFALHISMFTFSLMFMGSDE